MYLFVANFFNIDGSECSLTSGNFLEDGRYTLKIQVKPWQDKDDPMIPIEIGASIAMSGVMFVASTGYFFYQWMQNEITGTDIARKTLIESVSTGGSIGMEVLVIGGAKAAGVELTATPIGWVVLGLSGIGGYVGTKKALKYFLKKWGIPFFLSYSRMRIKTKLTRLLGRFPENSRMPSYTNN